MRVLHGPVNVGNQPWALSRQERALGVHSDLAVLYSTWLDYPADRVLSAASKRTVTGAARRIAFALRAPFRYDVLHCYFGLSFLAWNDWGPPNPLWYRDLWLAKRRGVKIFMTLQGCDVRLSDRSAARDRFTPCVEGHCKAKATCVATLDAQRLALIEDVLPRLDRVFVLNPELAHDVPGATFLPYANVDVDAYEPQWPRTGGAIRIVHAPSDASIKGSRYIVAAIERLARRYPIEFDVVEGVPHAQALGRYARADLVVDQVLAGWYGGFAVEAMALGKPVACYVRDGDLGSVPPAMRTDLPIVRITPDTVERDLERAIEARRDWVDWGRRARAFVERWHHPRRIATQMISAYRDPASRFDAAAIGENR